MSEMNGDLVATRERLDLLRAMRANAAHVPVAVKQTTERALIDDAAALIDEIEQLRWQLAAIHRAVARFGQCGSVECPTAVLVAP